MKILYLSHSYLVHYDQNIGKVIHNPAKELQELGNEVIVIVPTPKSLSILNLFSVKWKDYSLRPSNNDNDGVKVFYPRYLSLPQKILFRYSGYLMKLGVEELIDKLFESDSYDIIHAHSLFPDGYAAMVSAKKHKTPLVVTIRGTDIDVNIRNKYISQISKIVVSNSNSIIAPSPQIKKKIDKYFGINSKVVENGYDFREEIPNQEYSISKSNYSNKTIIISVSRLLETKGLQYNILAFNKLLELNKNIIYLIGGEGPYKKYLEDLVKKLGIQDNVIFLGSLNRLQVYQYLSLSDIFSMPSWQETFGISYLEAMVLSKPVIGCYGQGIDGLIENNISGMLVEPKNTEDLYNKIYHLIENPKIAQDIGSRGAKIANKLTWENHAKKIQDIYRIATNNDEA